jgi:hypothetical protein
LPRLTTLGANHKRSQSTSKLSFERNSNDGTFARELPYFPLPMNFPTRPFRAAVVSSSGALGLRLSVV